MSKYDVAVGLDEATLNKALSQLFNHAGFQEKIAKGFKQVDAGPRKYGLTWEISKPPRLSLEKVPKERWDAAEHAELDDELPEHNVFTLVLPELSLDVEYEGGERRADTIEAHLYAHLQVADGKVSVDPYGLWYDRASLVNIQHETLGSLVYFGLDMAEDALKDIALPAIPADLGVALGPPSAVIEGARLIVGMALDPAPVDLTAAAWPETGSFVLGSRELLNGLLHSQLHRIQNQTFPVRKEALGSPGSGGAAVAEAVIQVLEAHAQVDGTDLTQVGVTGRVSMGVKAVVSLLQAVGLSAVVRLLDKLHLAWHGLGYGVQLMPSPLYLKLGLLLQDRTVSVQLRQVRRCGALIWPRGSLPTILLSLALWPLTQLVTIIALLWVTSWINSKQPSKPVFTVPAVSFDLLGKPVSLTVSDLRCATHDGQLLIRSGLDFQ